MKLTPQIKQKIQEMYDLTPTYVHSVGLGYKYINGQNTGRICVVFSLEQKKPQEQVPDSELLPKELDVEGMIIETDVQQMPMIEFVSCYQPGDPEISRLQPVQSKMSMLTPMRGGQEIIQFPTSWTPAEGGGWYISIGTLGFFAIDNADNRIVGVTNSHVAIYERVACSDREGDSYNISEQIIWPPDGSSYQPGMLSADGNNPYKIISPSIKRYVPVSMTGKNYSDVALLNIDPQYLDENSYKIWAPTGQDPFLNFIPFATKSEIDSLLETNPRLFSTGRTTGPKGFSDTPECRLRVTRIGVSGIISGSEGVTDWSDMIAYEYEDFSPNPVAGGDSGSALIALIGGVYKIVGLVFAGGQFTGYASRIDRVAQEINIREWNGTGVNSLPDPPDVTTVSKDDPRASDSSFECQGKTYWQSGFTMDYQPSPCQSANQESESLCWQKVAEVEGDGVPDDFGWNALSLSKNGNAFAGLALPDGVNGRLGYARIYFKNGSSWIQSGQTIENTNADEGRLGSICLDEDGDTVAIGSTHADSSGANDIGRVRVYMWDNQSSSWIQKGSDIFGESAGDWSGHSVSLSDDGNTLAVGAPRNSRLGYTNAGSVRVYAWTGSVWSRKGGDIDGKVGGDQSGYSVSLSSDGNILAVGSPLARRNAGTPSQGPGKVHVYAWYGSAPWIQIAEMQGTNDMDEFGCSVALSGDGNKLAVGARFNQANYFDVSTNWIDGSNAQGSNGMRVGQVRIYDMQGGTPVQIGEDIYGDGYLDDFGSSVSINNNGSAVVAGAGQAHPERLRRRGYVRTFDWNGAFWVPRGKIQPKSSTDAMLKQVSMSGNGGTIVTGGAFPPEGNSWGGRGRVQVHEWNCPLPSVSANQNESLRTGSLWAWGNNEDGRLGIGIQDEGIHPSPTMVNSGSWRSVFAGYYDSHAIRFNHTRWAWGRNGLSNSNFSTFGDGTTKNSHYPKQIGSDTWKTISNSGRYVHAIKSDGTLWAWGENSGGGRLGIGTTSNANSPTQVGSANDWYTIAGTSGLREVSQGLCTLWAWGEYSPRNASEAQYSLPSAVSAKIPGRVGSNLLWKSISSGDTKIAIGYDDSIWIWGRISYNSLDDLRKIQLLNSGEWIKISAGHGHNLAIKSDGTLWAWGENTYGQTGLDPNENSLPYIVDPVQVGTHKWKEISAGWRHSLAIRSDGTLWAWGDNTYGQLGDGTTMSKQMPTQIGSNKWLSISAGWFHSLGILED